MKKLLALALCCLLAGCATAKPLTPQQKEYAEKIRNFPTTFSLSTDKAEEAWGRAQSFVGQYSSMKLQTVSPYVIQTYNPTGKGPKLVNFGYNVTRAPMGDKTQFTVQCFSDNMFQKKEAQQNASILAYYMATVRIIPRVCRP